jgi:quinol monooxygenase YgiN
MVRVGLFVKLQAKAGKEQELAGFLDAGLAMANAEATTPVWFAVQLAPATFAIFDAFADEAARQAHLDGPIARALMAKAPELLAEPPKIERYDILGAKLPR